MTLAKSDSAQERLESLMREVASHSPEHKINPSLQGFQALLSAMGEPQLGLQTIMVGGTNGKTSTSLTLEALAVTLGYSTGVFTSPHLHDLRERIRINTELVSPEMLCDAIERVRQYGALVAEAQEPPTYFETLTAAAFEIFADVAVDLAILEVGMGGRWDATNVTTPLTACLLPISLDHMQFLGDTIEKIAEDKCHIIKTGSIAVVAHQAPEALRAIERRCDDTSAPLLYEGRDFAISNRVDGVGGQSFDLRTPKGFYPGLFLPLFGEHQATNAAVAVTAIECITPSADSIPISLVGDALAMVSSPGRLEVVGRTPLFLVDACHNPAGAQVTARAVAESFATHEFVLVFGVMNDKNALEIMRPLIQNCVAVVVTAVSNARASEPAVLASIAEENFPDTPVYVVEGVIQACQQAIDLAMRNSSVTGVLAAGSVALAGVVRTWALGGEDR